MDFQRIVLLAALAFTLLFMWSAWQRDYGPQQGALTAKTTPAASSEAKSLPATPQPTTPSVPEAPKAMALSGKRVHVVTDLFDAEIDSVGGDLRRVDLLKFPVAVDKPDQPTRLLNDGEGEYFIAQAALLPANAADTTAPKHSDEFVPEANDYRLQPGEPALRVPMHWSNGNGLEVTKVYTFHRDSYVIDVDFQIKNGMEKAWQGTAYRQLQRSDPGTGSSLSNRTFTGAVISTDEKIYNKISFKDMDKEQLSLDTQHGWVAMMQHYFLGAWIPGIESTHHIYSKPLGDNRYMIGMYDQTVTVDPGKDLLIPAKLYVGPKHPEVLAAVAPNLDRTVDYGYFAVLAKPLFWLLDQINDIVKNWGWSIIILTILIKLAFFKLSAASYKSMAHMRKVQPKMAALKERYGDDKQKYQEAMMKLYREEKINPLGGCLPILVQIPVFIALYSMLLESVEMRQAPFILWIKDLSVIDPYYVLPVIMGATMLIQHRLNPTPLDPVQARVMMILPIVFSVFMAFIPAGLVLYMVVNNALSIAQQWYITRMIEKQA